jgi:hypothetical protein
MHGLYVAPSPYALIYALLIMNQRHFLYIINATLSFSFNDCAKKARFMTSLIGFLHSESEQHREQKLPEDRDNGSPCQLQLYVDTQLLDTGQSWVGQPTPLKFTADKNETPQLR